MVVKPASGGISKYTIITITDIALHTNKFKPSTSPGDKIRAVVESGEPGRVFYPIENFSVSDDRTILLEFLKADPAFIKFVQGEEAKGKKVAIEIAKDGVPVFLGEDTKRFMKSKNGKRIARGLAKKKD